MPERWAKANFYAVAGIEGALEIGPLRLGALRAPILMTTSGPSVLMAASLVPTSGGSAAVNAKKGVTLNIVLGAATLLVSTFLPVPTGMKGVIILFAAIALAAGSGVGWYFKSTLNLRSPVKQIGRAPV